MAGLRASDFSIGLVSPDNVGDSLIPVGACTELTNFEVNSGEIRTPGLLDVLVALPEDEVATGYFRDDINGGHIISTQINLYYYRADIGLRMIKANAFNGEGRPSMVRLNDILFVCDGYIDPFCVNISDIDSFTFPALDVEGSGSGLWPPETLPYYAYVWGRRVWLILNDSNELWTSWLDDATNFTIDGSLAADSGNIYISDSKENTFKSLIAAFDTLFVFKREGISLVKNSQPGNLDISNFLFIESYNTVTTHGPFSTTLVLDKLYSLGDFGLQELSVESLTNNLKLRTVASTIRSYLRDSLRRETLWCTLLSADEVPSVRFDLQGIGERSFVNLKISNERLDRNLTYFDLRLLGKAIDGQTNRTRFVLGSGNKVWLTDGSTSYPGKLMSKFVSPKHDINKGNFAKGRRIKVAGKGLQNVRLDYTWDDGPLFSDNFMLYGETKPVSLFGEAVFDESLFAPDSGEDYTYNVNAFALFGSGYDLTYTLYIAETKPSVTIETVNFEAQAFGTRPNV